MKKPILYLLMMLAFCASGDALAQKKKKKKKDKKSKNESKQWKKKMKSMDPLAFKAMSEELQVLKGETATKDRELSALRKQITSKNAEMAAKDAQVAELTQKLAMADAKPKNITSNAEDFTQGVVYKVQVGAFRDKDLMKFVNKKNFKGETDSDGVKKYTIGHFRDYWEANTFKKYLREMGVKDAWIVAYENNERKDITDVLDTSDIEKKASGAEDDF
ncbi:MAG: hypothetical protein ACI85I_000898 [Arenicella sp.]|jgi:hypothetical protein